MRFKFLTIAFLGFAFALLTGCATTPAIMENGEPTHITVQHCLIAFDGTLPGKKIGRTQEEAAELAESLLAKAKEGGDFNAIIISNTDDSPPGIYQMANHGLPGKDSRDVRKKVFKRGEMVAAFGDVGFKLKVGEYGMSEFSKDKSPFGWHIIKRIK